MTIIESKCLGEAIEIAGKRFNLEELRVGSGDGNGTTFVVEILRRKGCISTNGSGVCTVTGSKCIIDELTGHQAVDLLNIEDDDDLLDEDPYGPNNYED